MLLKLNIYSEMYFGFTNTSSKMYYFKHEYLRSRAYIRLSLSSPFSSPSPVTVSQKFDHYRDTRASILDPCIQGIFLKTPSIGLSKSVPTDIMYVIEFSGF